MIGTLKVLSTPIGNIKDISLRGIEELKSAKFIFAEDTRHSLALFSALGIDLKGVKLISCHSYNERERINLVKEKLLESEDVVLISDAGCPTISDPGYILIKSLIDLGFSVKVIPGVSALTAAMMGSGLDLARFLFLGFVPRTLGARKKLLLQAKDTGFSLIIFESASRIAALLDELFALLGSRKVVVARELTKVFETFHRGMLGAPLSPPIIEKGEMVVLIEGGEIIKEIDEEEMEKFIILQKGCGQSNKDIIKLIQEKFKINKNIAYDVVLKICK